MGVHVGGPRQFSLASMLSLGRVVKEEISDDNARLPCFNGRVVSWVSILSLPHCQAPLSLTCPLPSAPELEALAPCCLTRLESQLELLTSFWSFYCLLLLFLGLSLALCSLIPGPISQSLPFLSSWLPAFLVEPVFVMASLQLVSSDNPQPEMAPPAHEPRIELAPPPAPLPPVPPERTSGIGDSRPPSFQ